MAKINAANERVKRSYFQYLKEARGRDEATIDGVAKALARFEDSTGRRDFKRFHRQQAVAFKARLAEASNARTGERLSKTTMRTTLRELRAFFFWLAHQPGFKSHIAYADCDYFNLSDKDNAIATARRSQPTPTLEQVHRVLASMPADTVLQRRDRALIAFAAMTGARAAALASFQLGHVNVDGGFVEQDARTVRTKFAKSFRSYFTPIGGDAEMILGEWIAELREQHLWGASDPLFPATAMELDASGEFSPAGLSRYGWATSQPINAIFRKAFATADLPYFPPHSFRRMLVQFGYAQNVSIEAMKAFSQNLGHSHALTTLTSYGEVPLERQGELVRMMGQPAQRANVLDDPEVARLIAIIQSRPNGGLSGTGTGR